MKNIRPIFQNPYGIILLLAIFVNYSFSAPHSMVKMKDQNGKEIFKSIYYADGVLTDDIESLKPIAQIVNSFDESELVEYRKEQEKVMDYLLQKDSDFFDNFKNALLTKDARLIETHINLTNGLINEYIQKEARKNGINIQEVVKEYQNEIDLKSNSNFSPQGVALVVVITIVLVIGIAIAATITKVEGDDPLKPTKPVIFASISQQKFVAELISLS